MKTTSTGRITIGLMSGTSIDGEDAVAMRFSSEGMEMLGHAYLPFDPALAQELLSLALGNAPREIERMGDASVALARHGAAVVEKLLQEAGLDRCDVAALASHGQTIRHRPDRGFTIQLNHPALLAELTGINVIADLRSRDVAAGGEGAPLVPAFHAEAFGHEAPVVVLNVGGIANATLIPQKTSEAPVTGFDTGPGNMLLDHWMREQFGRPYDKDGLCAASGCVNEMLLDAMLADPYFAQLPPKSTGREYFSPLWLERQLKDLELPPEDVAATLTALTASSAMTSTAATLPDARKVLVCGGGAKNPTLMRMMSTAAEIAFGRPVPVKSTAAVGLDPMMVEGAAFAWLADAFLAGRPGNLPAVTHAKGPRLLGALYPKD